MELRVFSFCFVELTMINPLLVDRSPLVCPLMLGCTANDPSINHFSIPLTLELRISGRFLVTLIYFFRWNDLAQLSFSGYLNLVVMNEIAV